MRRALLFSAALALLVSACAALSKGAWAQDSLYFGFSRPGGQVTEEEWQAFVDAEVTPRFPDGLTQIQAQGQWKGKDGVVKEPCRVLLLLHPRDQGSDAKIQELRQAYKNRFQQDSVLRVTQLVNADF